MKPMFPTYVLESLQGHLFIVHDSIFALKKFSNFVLLVSLGINTHSIVAREDTLPVPKWYGKLYPPGSAAARFYGTPKMHKFSSSDSFPKLGPSVSSIGNFNYNLDRFLCDLLSPLVHNDYSC